ncbi:MAG TPA: hypothetical protein VFP71_03865 [Candidatus Angelobacter sp.]|nr:hypothetical protein [Candidatus Angelobacter sp.]
MFDGFYLFEWILMCLGVILFIALVIGFFYQLTHKRSIVGLLAFFVLDVLMIGYPSVQSFQINNGVISVEKQTDAVLSNPLNTKARQELQQQVEKLQNRQFSDPATLASLSKAEYVLGNDQAAKETLSKALQKNSELPAAKDLQAKMDSVAQLAPLTAKVESNPADEQAKAQLNQALNTVAQQRVANPSALLTVARAQAALGDRANAEKTTAIVQKINPKLAMTAPH